MPAPVHVIVICPLAKLADLATALSITPTAPVFTLSDPIIRPVTHRARSGAVNATQRATIDDHLVTPNPLLEGVIFCDYPRDLPSPYPQLLIDNGLTTNDGSF